MNIIHDIGPSMPSCRPRVLALGAGQERLPELERQATKDLRGRLGELSRHICGELRSPGFSPQPARACLNNKRLTLHPWSYNDLGLVLTKSGKGVVEATLTITDKHKNGYGFCHGGVLTAACDTVIAWAGETICQKNDVAINSSMYTRLFRPTKIGDKLNFRAKVINPADKAPEFLVVITNQDDKVVGFARGDVAMKDPGATKPMS